MGDIVTRRRWLVSAANGENGWVTGQVWLLFWIVVAPVSQRT
jgi:hypothetical protein